MPANQNKSKGDGYLEYFKSYADSHDDHSYSAGSALKSGTAEASRPFEGNIGTAQSIGVSKFDYNYSTSNYDNVSGVNNSSSNKITYDFSQPRNNAGFDFNFSALSKVSEE